MHDAASAMRASAYVAASGPRAAELAGSGRRGPSWIGLPFLLPLPRRRTFRVAALTVLAWAVAYLVYRSQIDPAVFYIEANAGWVGGLGLHPVLGWAFGGLLAAGILALADESLAARLAAWRAEQSASIGETVEDNA